MSLFSLLLSEFISMLFICSFMNETRRPMSVHARTCTDGILVQHHDSLCNIGFFCPQFFFYNANVTCDKFCSLQNLPSDTCHVVSTKHIEVHGSSKGQSSRTKFFFHTPVTTPAPPLSYYARIFVVLLFCQYSSWGQMFFILQNKCYRLRIPIYFR